jgi:hypothetical protein
MRDILFFWSVIFQILGVKNAARGTADLSWDKGTKLGGVREVLLFIVLGSGLFDLGILMFWIMYLMSRIWSWWLHVSQVCRIILLVAAVTTATRPMSPTNAYYATCEAIIFGGLSFLFKCADYIKNGSAIGKMRLSAKKRAVLFVLFWNFFVLLIGAVIFKFVEHMPFSDAWNFVNVTALTIGYGNLTPKTVAGKILVITFGNLMLMMAAYFIIVLREVMSLSRMKQKRNVALFFFILINYALLGAVAFMKMENWTYLDSIFFTWMTLTTVGYGNIVPVRAISWEFWLFYVYLSCALYAFALALVTDFLTNMVNNHAQKVLDGTSNETGSNHLANDDDNGTHTHGQRFAIEQDPSVATATGTTSETSRM